MFESFKGGPDWILERSLAEDSLSAWRLAVMHQWQAYEGKKEHLQKDYEAKREAQQRQAKYKQHAITRYFPSQNMSRYILFLLCRLRINFCL